MSDALPKVYLVRHGETAWSVTGQHTGMTDIPLTVQGEINAQRLRARLADLHPALVLSSPLQRARRTCELAGFGETVETDPDLCEWGYGDYEGRTTKQIQVERPGWSLFRDGCPNGETIERVCQRADRLIARVRAVDDDVLLFGHGHMFRIIAARWLGLPGQNGALFLLSPASVSTLSYEHSEHEPAIALWNGLSRIELEP